MSARIAKPDRPRLMTNGALSAPRTNKGNKASIDHSFTGRGCAGT